jgi:hypothetical protein
MALIFLHLATRYGAFWWMDIAAAHSSDPLSAALRTILRGVMAALGAWGLEAEIAVLLHRRIAHAAARIERMLARFRAGRLRRIADRKARNGAIRRGRVDTLPKRFGWLVIAGGHRAAGFGSQLRAVLAEPEMTALLAASPEAVRILRPLCRALAVELPCFADTPRAPRPTRPRKPRPRPEPFRIPLPRGVLSAARRAGFGKLC